MFKKLFKRIFENPKIIIECEFEWTLQKAKEDYQLSNPRCSKCKFSKEDDKTVCVDRAIYPYPICEVKSKSVKDIDAVKCKYYTVRS